jgi:hypothetical protein
MMARGRRSAARSDDSASAKGKPKRRTPALQAQSRAAGGSSLGRKPPDQSRSTAPRPLAKCLQHYAIAPSKAPSCIGGVAPRPRRGRPFELGCFFSVNGHEVRSPRILDLVPPERLLTETDFPHSRRYDRAATRPGVVGTVEAHFEARWDADRLEIRRQLWRNFGSLLSATDVIGRMPRAILAALATAATRAEPSGLPGDSTIASQPKMAEFSDVLCGRCAIW